MTVRSFLLRRLAVIMFACLALLSSIAVLAHGVSGGDLDFIAGSDEFAAVAFAYLGAKHMVTGYDHLLYLAGIMFFVQRTRDVLLYATLFAVGHSITLILGVMGQIGVDSDIVDALIGLSVVYKASENLGGLRALGWRLDPRLAVLFFGLIHGFGLSTKLQQWNVDADAALGNLLAFNVGVELGQAIAIAVLLSVLRLWPVDQRRSTTTVTLNTVLMIAGFVLFAVHVTSFAIRQ